MVTQYFINERLRHFQSSAVWRPFQYPLMRIIASCLVVLVPLTDNERRMVMIHTDKMPWEPISVAGISVKDLVHQAHGTAKLIRLAAYAQYPEHRHPNRTEYVYVLRGVLTVTIDGERQEASSGDFMLIPQNILHALVNNTPTDVVLWVGAIIPGSESP